MNRLTDREKQILELVKQGDTNKTIAKKLGISVQTVKNHRYHIYRELNATNGIDAVMKVYTSEGVKI